ncbi:hypothetical protein VTL71DRAFT_12306 [Oculimacula yallundae]|uniref:LysM domain-containing protein n=1 Tax=Oculimacula yallundae TaxID=86028 RepID=A0ABR4CPB9_9HELO
MRSSILVISTLASLILPAFAQIGTNCNVVRNVTVKAGDSLAAISKAANVTLDQVIFVNTQITNPRSIKVGDGVKIPDSRCVAPVAKPLAEPTAICTNRTAKTITVVAGDTLNIIAKEKLGITLPALLAANPQIKNPDLIAVGDVLNVPVCGATTTPKPTPGAPTPTTLATTTTSNSKRGLTARASAVVGQPVPKPNFPREAAPAESDTVYAKKPHHRREAAPAESDTVYAKKPNHPREAAPAESQAVGSNPAKPNQPREAAPKESDTTYVYGPGPHPRAAEPEVPYHPVIGKPGDRPRV